MTIYKYINGMSNVIGKQEITILVIKFDAGPRCPL